MKSETTKPGVSGSSNTHARLAPSGSSCWSNCTAAPAFLEANSHRVPKDSGSVYADEGTEAHEWAAKVLLKQITLDEVPEHFREGVGLYVDHCLALVPEGVSYQVEVECPLFYQEDAKGTCDFAILTDERVTIRDKKWGAGVLVHAIGNTQFAIYAYSLICLLEDVYDFTDDTIVDMAPFQPRHREAHDVEPWVITLGEMREFCKKLDYAAIQANTAVSRVRDKLPCGERDISAAEILEAAPMVEFAPGEKPCRWCRNKAFCEIRLAASTEGMDAGGKSGAELIALLPDLSKEDKKKPVEERIEVVACEVVPDDAVILSDEYLVSIYRNAKSIKRFLDDVEEHLTNRAIAGDAITGTKLVEGRAGNRAWANIEEADNFLKGKKMKIEDRYKMTLKSPTEMEKILDISKQPKRTQSRWAELVSRSPGKPVLALADDKRDAIAAPVDLLPDITTEDDEV